MLTVITLSLHIIPKNQDMIRINSSLRERFFSFGDWTRKYRPQICVSSKNFRYERNGIIITFVGVKGAFTVILGKSTGNRQLEAKDAIF